MFYVPQPLQLKGEQRGVDSGYIQDKCLLIFFNLELKGTDSYIGGCIILDVVHISMSLSISISHLLGWPINFAYNTHSHCVI